MIPQLNLVAGEPFSSQEADLAIACKEGLALLRTLQAAKNLLSNRNVIAEVDSEHWRWALIKVV